MFNKIIKYFLENRVITLCLLVGIIIWGFSCAPFNWHGGLLPANPVPVDAIPDIGDNQQIVATEWAGRSPKDIQDQITYPLSSSLFGIPGVKTIRCTSMFGMSFIYLVFNDNVEFYWSRSRILEKLSSLPKGILPAGVQPTLGPDATALGQIYWYTLEGRNPKTGKPAGGWDPEELRTLQDFYVKYALASTEGVSEVASVGGYVKQYQVELNPDALRSFRVTSMDVMNAIQKSNLDIGAGTIEVNKAEYLIRGVGYIKNISDLEQAVITVRKGTPITIKDVAVVEFGPAPRRGGLDKQGVEAVGGVVVARYGSNPMQVIDRVKSKIQEMKLSLPQKVLADGSISKVTVVPFYDRSGLIKETLGTLETAISHEILICIIVIIVLVFNLRASVIIASLLPIAVLMTFILMRYTGVSANIVALSGIAIAIGVMVDVGVVFVESIVRHQEMPCNMEVRSGKPLADLIYKAVSEVSGPIITAMITTVVSFLPVFALQAQEGKLFSPLAYTKTFALASALVLGIVVLPTLAYFVFSIRVRFPKFRVLRKKRSNYVNVALAIAVSIYFLAKAWLPMGPDKEFWINVLFVVLVVGLIITSLWLLVIYYESLLRWCLGHRWLFMLLPLSVIVVGGVIWKGTGKEFMPRLNEGSFLLMPTSMPHTGVEQNIHLIQTLDQRVENIPEIASSVGKWGRTNSALDPAPIQMFENTINYRPEYALDAEGMRSRFKVNAQGAFVLTDGSVYDPSAGFRLVDPDRLIIDPSGNYLRQWRPEIKTPDDIWKSIVKVSKLPGLTSAPKLQPIEARLVMLSTGMRAPMGLKVFGPDLESIEKAGKILEAALKTVPSILPSSVFYDRSLGAPYLEIQLNRKNMARYGVQVADLQQIISSTIGGVPLTTTVEGRERFAVRLRYARELRDSPAAIEKTLVATPSGAQIPLGELADITYEKGAQMIQSENSFLLGYVLFDKIDQKAEVDVVQEAMDSLKAKIDSRAMVLPRGVSYQFAGNYEQESRASKRLLIVVPIALLLVLLILYLQFKSITASCIHFSGVIVAFAGGFILVGLYGQDWFLNFSFFGVNMRDLFQIHPINLSVAVWVGFIALFGIATDDGVLMGSYIHQVFKEQEPQTKLAIREAVVSAGLKRVRPAAMTTAIALIALLPVLSSTGKGAEIMIPMAIPTFGGMAIQAMTMFVVPVLQCWWREGVVKRSEKRLNKTTHETTNEN